MKTTKKMCVETLNRQTVSNQVKRKAVDDINEKSCKIIHSHLTQDVKHFDNIRFNINTFNDGDAYTRHW
jgi:hypothetical protein